MIAVMGVTGQVGSRVAAKLLRDGQNVRVVVRASRKGDAWRARGCEVATGDLNEPSTLARAFEGTEGAFVMLPPMFDPSPGFPEAMTAIAELHAALEDAVPLHVVCLSTIGAQVPRDNLLSQLRLLEEALSSSRLNVTFLRAAWFMENYLWDIPAAKENGVVQSFLQPLERAIPMVATDDIGELAGTLLQEPCLGFRRVQLEGPALVSPNEVAEVLGQLLGKSIRMEAVPRNHWEETFRSQGMKNPVPRIQMLDGFNEGWIRFEDGQESRRGSTAINTVIARLAV